MSSGNGSNGILDGQANVQKFESWKLGVLDFRPFIHQGELNKSRIAASCGFGRDVFRTNPKLRDVLLPALVKSLEARGMLKAGPPDSSHPIFASPPVKPSPEAMADRLMAQNEAYRAEIAELRRELGKRRAIEGLLSETGRLPW